MICNVFKRSLKSQILLAQSLKNWLTQADAHLLSVSALLRCSPSFLGKAPCSLMLSVASDVHLGNLSPLVAISTPHPFGDPKVWSLRVFHGHQQPSFRSHHFVSILGNNSSLCQFSLPALATSAGWLHPKTRSRNLSLVSIVSVNIEHWQTEFYMAKIVKTSLVQIPSATLKWHSENCPSSCWLSNRSFGSVTTSLCQGRFWKPMEVTRIADKFWYMLTRTGATCLKPCRAESLKVRPLHPST